MVDTDLTWEESVDPAACNADSDTYDQFSRDPERTPFQWSTEANGGFSTNSSTWLPVNPYYLITNVESERAKTKSYFNVYKQMSQLRQTKTLQYGSLKYGNVGDDILAIKR